MAQGRPDRSNIAQAPLQPVATCKDGGIAPHGPEADHSSHGENVMNTKRLVAAAVIATVIASPALAQGAPQHRQHSSNPAYDVYVGGQYVGSDPDPNVRAQLQRRYPGGSW